MKTAIEKFFSSEAYAVVGVSRKRHKFGNTVFTTMKRLNYTVYPVNPHLPAFEDVPCLAGIHDLPETVNSVVLVVHPEDADQAVRMCGQKGIENIWLQTGAQSDGAIAFGREQGLNVVHGQCILMFVEPVKSIHALHRWMNKLTGVYPHA